MEKENNLKGIKIEKLTTVGEILAKVPSFSEKEFLELRESMEKYGKKPFIFNYASPPF